MISEPGSRPPADNEAQGARADRLRELEQRVEALETERSRSRERLADMVREARNALAVIRSMVRRTAATSRSVEDFARHLEGRIGAIARTHSSVLRSPDLTVDLAGLIGDEFLAGATKGSQSVTISGPPVRLPAKLAAAIGLALHELTVNALKFGALSEPDGAIRITWSLSEAASGPVLTLSWTETRRRVDREPMSLHRGFGLDVLERSLPYETGATTEVRLGDTSFSCLIRMPIQAPPRASQ